MFWFPSRKSSVDEVERLSSSDSLDSALAQARKTVQFSAMDESTMVALFNSADVDHSDFLDEEEVHKLLLGLGVSVSREQLGDMLEAEDCNRDGVLSKEEFIAICYKLQDRTEEYKLHRKNMMAQYIRKKFVTDSHSSITEGGDGSKEQQSRSCEVVPGSSILTDEVEETKRANGIQLIMDEDESFYDYNPAFAKGPVRVLAKSTKPMDINNMRRQRFVPKTAAPVEACADARREPPAIVSLSAKNLKSASPGSQGSISLLTLENGEHGRYDDAAAEASAAVACTEPISHDFTLADIPALFDAGLDCEEKGEGSIPDDISFLTANSHASGPQCEASTGDAAVLSLGGNEVFDGRRYRHFDGFDDAMDTDTDTFSITDWNAEVLEDGDESSDPSNPSSSNAGQDRTVEPPSHRDLENFRDIKFAMLDDGNESSEPLSAAEQEQIRGVSLSKPGLKSSRDSDGGVDALEDGNESSDPLLASEQEKKEGEGDSLCRQSSTSLRDADWESEALDVRGGSWRPSNSFLATSAQERIKDDFLTQRDFEILQGHVLRLLHHSEETLMLLEIAEDTIDSAS